MKVLVDHDGELTLHRATMPELMLARVRARRLDRELARGTAPETSAARAVRALRLVSPGYRHAIGANLLRLAAPHQSEEVAELARMLLGACPVPARTVAIAVELITDGAGPLYQACGGDQVAAVARRAMRTPT